jgi:hypothetical protein
LKLAKNNGNSWYYRCHGDNTSEKISDQLSKKEISAVLKNSLKHLETKLESRRELELIIGHGLDFRTFKNSHEFALWED